MAKVLYPAFTSNDPANTYLATGQAQWGSQFIPNIKTFYTSKSPDNHYWFPPVANVSLIPNLTVRRAEQRSPSGRPSPTRIDRARSRDR